MILDDGFQDYGIKKDLNIICFNNNQLIGNGLALPAGPLREGLDSLKEADLILINGKKNIKFEKKILLINKKLDVFYTNYKPINPKKFKGKKLMAIAGIGNPKNFFDLLIENGLNVKRSIPYPDHYNFKKDEIIEIINQAKEKNYTIVTTEKDLSRIENFKFSEIYSCNVKLEIENKSHLITLAKKIYD